MNNTHLFFSKTDFEIMEYLSNYWEIDGFSENGTIRLIGAYEKAELKEGEKPYGFFDNIRNQHGDLLFYPENIGRVKIRYFHKDEFLRFPLWNIQIKLADIEYRKKFDNPFLLTIDRTSGEASAEIRELVRKKGIIESIFSETLANPTTSTNQRGSLEQFNNAIYTKRERLIFELIQNADDFPDENLQKVDLSFSILEKIIIVTHNGRPFRDVDVRAISSIGNSGKKDDDTTTGYKGIGFKSVFYHSEKVYVNSGNYCFRYDKTYSVFKDFKRLYPSEKIQRDYAGREIELANPNKIPWELAPIWTEKHQLPTEITEFSNFFTSPVSFALFFGKDNINDFESKLFRLFTEPRFILFLRNISQIKVFGQQKSINITRSRQGLFCTLSTNNIDSDIFLMPEIPFTVKLSEKDIASFKNVDDIPQKLISAGGFSFTFAIGYSKDKLIPVKDSVLFTYLPTEDRKYNFPFLVNSDFVTTPNREEIQPENKWNKFVFERIGFEIFNWAKSIIQSNEPYRFSALTVIPEKFKIEKNDVDSVKVDFNNGFDKAIKEIAFLPTANGSLCKVDEALADLTGLSEIIGNELFVRAVNPIKTVIDNGLEFKSKLIGLQGITIFGEDELKRIFANSTFQQALNPQLLLQVLKFLQEKEYNFSDIGLLQSENSQGLLMPSSLYFQTSEADKSLLTFKTVYFLHPTINDYAEGNSKFKQWLVKLGVKSFVGKTFITEKILGNLHNINSTIKISETQNRNFWNFIFKHHSKDDISKFSSLHVLTSNNLYKPLCNCYLSDIYRPTYSVESVANQLKLSNFHFVAPYFTAHSGIEDWREFFRSAKIKKSEGVEIFENEVRIFIQNNGLNENNYLAITKFVFEIFNQNRDKIAPITNFKVFTLNAGLQTISQCILSDDYTQDLRLASVLPEQVLPNQIHSVYLQQISNNRQNWKEFFIRLNPNVELTPADIVKRKISILASNPSLVTHQNVEQVWKTILSFKEDLLKTHKEELKKIPLLLKNNSLIVPTICYFPKEYSPNTEIEELLTGYYDYFISPTFNSISGLSYSDLKIFFKQIGVEEEIRRSNVGNSYFDVSHIEHLSKFDFAKRFWAYFQKNQSLFTINTSSTFKTYIQSNPSIPCLDNAVRIPNVVHSYRLKDLVNDSSVTCGIEFSTDLETFLGLQQRLTVSKCFQILNSIAVSNGTDDKKIRLIYDDLLYRFSNESLSSYSTDIANFKQNGKLLSNKDTFQSVTSLFYQDVSANYVPLDESEKVVRRFGDKDYWKKFEVVLKQLDIQIITVSDFSLDALSSKYDAVELNKTLNNSIAEFAKKIDTINFQSVENKLKNKFSNLAIYYSPNLKMSCSKLNYSPIVPNYYDTSQNTIYYSGNWNSISNAKLIEYLFKAFDISESQISKDEFVSILLRNIPAKYEMPSAPPESLQPDGRTGRFGEELVYKELVAKFGESRVNWLNQGGETYKEYDFEILSRNNEVSYFIDAKATTTGEITGDTVPIYIKPNEWTFMQKCKDNYIIARVYNAKSSRAYIKYLKLGLQNMEEI
jgi:hypothetical protein